MFGAGIKKEFRLFTRGFRFIGLILIILGVALAYPALYKSMEFMTEQLDMLVEEVGDEELMGATDSVTGMMDSMAALYGGSMANVGFYTAVTGMLSEGSLIIMLLLMATAGGEQKKRSTIMPSCAGLTPAGYVLPKFVIYPIVAAGLVFIGACLAALVSNFLFSDTIPWENVLFSGACAAGNTLFTISLYFLLGLCTGRPGIGVLVMFLGSALIPLILTIFRIDEYNPYALTDMIMTSYSDADMKNFTISLIVSVVLSVIFCMVTLIVTTLKRIDNKGAGPNI